MIPVSLIVPTRNEELNLDRCLESVQNLVDECFVIDSESADNTTTVAQQRGATVVNLAYVHNSIIPWIYQWGLENLPIRNDWVLILEADQALTPALRSELETLFARSAISEGGFYIRREQIFRGRRLRFGGYGNKYMLKLFRRDISELDPNEEDTRVYVRGTTGRLQAPILEHNWKEDEILFYLQKHLRYAEAFARDELRRRNSGIAWKTKPRLFGTPDQRTLWLKTMYYKAPLYIRPFIYFSYRYFILLGILDGKEGAIFHFLQAFWFRLITDIRLEELMCKENVVAKNRARAVESQ